MFVITDCTVSPARKTISHDVKDVRDIIVGITGNEEIADKAYKDVGDMHWGDVLIANPYYIIDCVNESNL